MARQLAAEMRANQQATRMAFPCATKRIIIIMIIIMVIIIIIIIIIMIIDIIIIIIIIIIITTHCKTCGFAVVKCGIFT